LILRRRPSLVSVERRVSRSNEERLAQPATTMYSANDARFEARINKLYKYKE